MGKKLIFMMLILIFLSGCIQKPISKPVIQSQEEPKIQPIKQIEDCGGIICSKYHECINNKCILKNVDFKVGVIYIYSNEDTYNPNWKSKIKDLMDKSVLALRELTNSKVGTFYDILGETKVNTYCWNPGIVGLTIRNKEENTESIYYLPLPGSQFKTSGFSYLPYYKDAETEVTSKIIKNKCKNCIIKRVRDDVNYKEDIISINCQNNLASLDNMYKLKQEVIEKLNINSENYDIILLIFGKLGHILPIDEESLRYRCSTIVSVFGGYFISPNLIIVGENSLLKGGVYDCPEDTAFPGIEEQYGWHFVVHEILHRFGAKDHYDTATVFGYSNTYPEEARKYDSRADECVMGNNERPCMEDHSCTDKNLEEIYLCKWNRRDIGLI